MEEEEEEKVEVELEGLHRLEEPGSFDEVGGVFYGSEGCDREGDGVVHVMQEWKKDCVRVL